MTPLRKLRRESMGFAIGSPCCSPARSASASAPPSRWSTTSAPSRRTTTVAFGASAIASYVVPSSGEVLNATWVNLGTFVGAICFLVAALLVRPPRAAELADAAVQPPAA